MVKIKKIKDEYSSVKHQLETEDLKPAQRTRLKKRLQFLDVCMRYIETNPTDAFVSRQLEQVEAKIKRRMDMFNIDEEKLSKKEVSKMRKDHEKNYDVPHLRNQMRALRYLTS